MSENGSIVVVEDNDFVRMQIVKFLEDDGYAVFQASRGDTAVEIVDTESSIDLAIVDVRMEPMDGFEFISILRGRNLDIPVVLVTGDDNSDLLAQSGKLGVAAVLIKPVQKERLLMTVKRTIDIKNRKAKA